MPIKIQDISWERKLMAEGDTLSWYYLTTDTAHSPRITVLHRLTGFTSASGGDVYDTESGYKDEDGKFWLASGDFDIREYPELTLGEAIALIKQRANNCIGE